MTRYFVMVNKSVNINLPVEVWNIIDNQFKLNKESDAEILCNIIRNHLAEHGFIQIYKVLLMDMELNILIYIMKQ